MCVCVIAEAKRRLSELREESELKQGENQDLQVCIILLLQLIIDPKTGRTCSDWREVS